MYVAIAPAAATSTAAATTAMAQHEFIYITFSWRNMLSNNRKRTAAARGTNTLTHTHI